MSEVALFFCDKYGKKTGPRPDGEGVYPPWSSVLDPKRGGYPSLDVGGGPVFFATRIEKRLVFDRMAKGDAWSSVLEP